MFHRFIRLLFLSVFLFSSGAGVIAQLCPDTYPKITGPDVVGVSSNPVKYFTPLVAGHTYTWVVKQLPGMNVVGGSTSDELYQLWNVPGDYQIELSEGIAGNGCTAVSVTPPMSVLVKPMLTAYYYYEPDVDHGCYFNEVTFTATGNGVYPPSDQLISYDWWWGEYDGITPVTWVNTNITPVGPPLEPNSIVKILFPPTSGKTYATKLIVSKTILGRLWDDEITDFVYVDPDKYKPTALISPVNPPVPNCLYNQYNFSAAGSTASNNNLPDVFIKQCDWFVDGVLFLSSTGIPCDLTATYTFATPGIYNITVTITNTMNCTNTTPPTVVTVGNTVPLAAFTVAQTCVNEPAPFTDNSLANTGTITDWWWNWDDGSTSQYNALINPPPNPVTHVFTDLLPHYVTLTVTNSNGCVNTTLPFAVLAQPSPKADFTYPVVNCTGDIVQFNDMSSPLTGTPIATYLWNFDDPLSPSNTSTIQNPTHLFSGPGNYFVTLTVTNEAGCANTKTLPISNPLVVSPHPDVDFSILQGVTMYEQIFTAIINPAQNVNNNVYWEFGDGTNGFGSPITHNYPGPGNYTAQCTGIDMVTGCSTIVQHSILLGAPPAACFTANPPNQCQNVPILFVPCPPGGAIATEDWDFGDGTIAQFTPPNVPASPNHAYTAPGLYHVIRVLNVGTPLETSFDLWVTIYDAPTANFTWFSDPLHMHQGEACSGEDVYFTDQSYANTTPPGTIYQWLWNFDDPLSGPLNTSTIQNPTHAFTPVSMGGQSSYNVTLQVWENLQDCPSAITQITVVINPPVPVDYTIPTVACVDQVVTFQSTGMDPLTIANWTWSFGDGLPDTHDPISTLHAYQASSIGINTTTLTVTDTNGCTNTISKDINVVPAPTAGFTYSSPSCEGDTISFTDQSLPGGPSGDHIVQWEWFWGDGSIPDPEIIPFGSNPNVQHKFPVVLGTYSWPVRLRVTNTYGCVNEIIINVNLLPAPVASFATVLGTNQCAGQPVQFQSLSDPNGGGPIVEWFWNFGDPPPNNTSNTENPSHTYAAAGTYTVTLIVKTANNCLSEVFSSDVIVNQLPVALFANTTVCEGNPTVFTDMSTPNASGTLTYFWNFGGGNTSTSPSPTFVFATAGLHPVTLTITNSNGCTHQVTRQVMVNPKAIPMFHFTTPSCQNSTITFTSDSYIPPTPGSTASITTWAWDFGDGNFGSGPLAVHSYTDNLISHLVELTVTTSDGCDSSIQKIITHFGIPTANFSHTGDTCENQTISFYDNSTTIGGIAIASRLWNFGDPGSIANNTSTLQNPTHDFTTFGIFYVSLVVTDVNGCASTPKIIPITILAKPVAAFSATSACLGSGTFFTDQSTPAGSIATWLWQYDDGLQDNVQNPVHFFATSGVHSVILTVTTADGCFKTYTGLVEVFPKPLVTFSSNAPVCAGSEVTFTDYSTTGHGYVVYRVWNFGDGPDDPKTFSATTTHTYATGGTYNVTLTVHTSDSCVESNTIPIQIQYSPFADFYNSNTLCQGMTVQFNNSSSQNGGSPITSWLWNFGDLPSGSLNTSTAPNPTHTFVSPGPYIITLTVGNVDNCTDTVTKTININPTPTAIFTASQECQGQPTVFDASASNTLGDIASFAWDFGDFQTGTGQIANHTYTDFGYYNVVLTITNDSGCVATSTQIVFVQPKPISQFTSSQVNCMGADVLFYDQSFIPAGFAGSINAWHWDFGDGIGTADYDPITVPTVVTYAYTDGLPIHTVTLTVTTTFDCESFVSHDVNSIPSPIPHITSSPVNCVNQSIQFSSGTSSPNGGSPIQSYAWTFGDGGTSNQADPVHTYVTPGTYPVTLTVTNASGCVSPTPDSKDVIVNPKPLADFTTDTPCQGAEMTFTDASVPNAGVIVSYFWDFGDSQTSNNPPPTTHTYAMAGIFQVKLTVTTDLGCFKDTIKAVEVYGKPFASFTTSGANCAGDSVSFSAMSSTAAHGYITEYKWDFDDLSPVLVMTTPNAKHKFTNGGTYNVKLTITTSDDCTAEKINPVVINERPLANFEYPTVLCANSTIQFTDISQGGGGAALTGWEWNFGDPGSGGNNTSPLQNPIHIFTVGNPTDTVTLIVTNAYGCIDTIFHVIAINDAPFADFTADTSCMSSSTQFTDASTTPAGTTLLSWDWNFGDPASGTNNVSTLQNPTHVYNTQGTYTVTLQVTNSNQCVKDTMIQIIVNPAPTAMFQYTPACVGTETQFTDMSIAPGSSIQSWTWDFDDGTPPVTIQNPVHTYATAGNYDVLLIVVNLANCVDSITIPVIARPTPIAAFTSSSYYCPAGKVDFQDISTAPASSIAERLWIFEPGYTSNSPNPSHTFSVTNMNYAVTLIVTDTYGCMDTIVDSVFVKPGFIFSYTNDTVCEGYPTHFFPLNQTPGDTLYSVSWNFGDPGSGPNNTSTAYSPYHTFTGAGSFIVKMKAYNSDNCVDSVYREITVYKAPEPLFSYRSTLCNDTIQFTDSTQITGSGTIQSWSWNFGDPSSPDNTSALQNPSHRYASPGIYTVTLVMTSSHNCVDSITRNVQRFPCITTTFTYNDTLCARNEIAFTDNSFPVTLINQWEWTWGDGTNTTYTTFATPVMHTYADSGTYHVKLQIWALVDGTTITDSVTSNIRVNPTPIPYFSNVPVCLNQVTLFRDTSKTFGAGTSKWNWTFGVNASDTSSIKNPSHTYDTAGIYNVQLIVMNKYGCQDSLTKPTRVYGLPVAKYENTAACSGDPTFFSDLSVASDTAVGFWRWSFGDPTTNRDTSQLQEPNYSYPNTGDFNVRMIVQDYFGCIDTVDSTVRVNVTPVSSFTLINGYNGKQGQVKMNNLSTGAESYLWNFGNGKSSTEENPVALFTENDTYTIQLISTNQFNCADTTYYTYELLFKGLYVPNAFFPSSTNLGVRLFRPVGINLKQYHVTVFDIWGHLMWESTKLDDQGMPTEGWDGTYEGVLMPQGNYMWKINALFVDDSQWEGSDIGVGGSNHTMGTVTLIR